MKHTTRQDARTVETEKVLRSTLEQMILEYRYTDITVSELTRRAGVHRKTFYLHYESIPQMFDSLVEEISGELLKLLESLNLSSLDAESLLNAYNRYLSEKGELHRKLFCDEGYQTVFHKVQDKVCACLLAQLPHHDGESKKKAECIVIFIAYGLNAVWRMNYTSADPVPTEELSKWCSVFLDTGLAQLAS